MAAGSDKVVVQSCSVLVAATGAWREKTLLYQTDVILNQSDLAYTFDSPDGWLERRIMLEDLIGIRVPAESDSTEATCTVEIHSLPLVSTASWFSANQTQSRKHTIDQILFANEETFQQNMKLALAWKRTVMKYCEKAVKRTFIHADSASTCRCHGTRVMLPILVSCLSIPCIALPCQRFYCCVLELT